MRVLLPIPDTNLTALRPIILEVVRDICAITHIPSDGGVMFPGDIGTMQQTGSNINHQGEQNSFGHASRIKITVDEEYIEEHALTTPHIRRGNIPFFVDDKLKILMRPEYAFTEINIGFHFRSTDRVSALRWRDDIRNKVAMHYQSFVHKASYSYNIPIPALVILQEIHRLRENVKGYGDTFHEWLDKCFSPYVTIVTNQAGKQASWVVSETALRLQGGFDFTAVPEKGEYEDSVSRWNISFNYKLQIDKPVGITLDYPIVVHNQLLSSKFRRSVQKDHNEEYQKRWSESLSALSKFETIYNNDVKNFKFEGIAIPGFDDFYTDNIPGFTSRIFTALLQLEREGAGKLLNLNDMGKYTLKKIILDFLKKEAQYVTKSLRSVFQLHLYRNKDLLFFNNANPVVLMNDLEVRTNLELDFRDIHHIRFSIINDLSVLPKEALERLRQYALVFKEVIKVIAPWYNHEQIVSMTSDPNGPVARDLFYRIVDEVIHGYDSSTAPGKLKHQHRLMTSTNFNTVGLFNIEADILK